MEACFSVALPLTRRALGAVLVTCSRRKQALTTSYVRRLHKSPKNDMAGVHCLRATAAPVSSKVSDHQSNLSEQQTTMRRGRTRVRKVLEQGESLLGQNICVKGWVRTLRDQKRFAFIDLNDGSSVSGLQIIIEDAKGLEVVQELKTGCAISVEGEVARSLGKGQSFELKASRVELIGKATDEYPLQKKRHNLEFLRSIAHLRPRTNIIGAMSRVRSVLALATHEFFGSQGFLYLNAPIITASDCEGAGEMFRVTTVVPQDGKKSSIPVRGDDGDAIDFKEDFFGQPAFLTVSGQLSAETYACGLGDVYTFGPTFRAENSNTSRHLAEFWMIEPEMAFADLQDDMDNAEAFVKFVINAALSKASADLQFFDRFVEQGLLEKMKTVANEDFARVSYSEAIEILEAANQKNKKGKRRFEFEVKWGVDLQSEHERYLAEHHYKRPVFVYNYPAAIKAFYMKANKEDGGRTVHAMDLLVPGIGELIGGSAREDSLEVLEEKIEEMGLNKEDYWWYLDLRRHGSVPHAGYGLGFERLVQFVTGIDNIRDVIPYPRYPGNAQF